MVNIHHIKVDLDLGGGWGEEVCKCYSMYIPVEWWRLSEALC